MTPETVGAIFAGLTGLLASMAALLTTRSKANTADYRAVKLRVRALERRLLLFGRYAFDLRAIIVGLGGTPPEQPQELTEDLGEDDP